jgi:hypothetical protein
MKDGAQYAVAFDAFTKDLEEAHPEEVKKWRGLVEQWEAKQHTGPEESPFDVKDQGGLGDLFCLALAAEYDDGSDESPCHPAEICGRGICLHRREQRGRRRGGPSVYTGDVYNNGVGD